MEEVKEGQDFRVFVDFAITPDALEKALISLQKMTKGRVIIVFGATGDRDKGKRPDMGKAAARYADRIYLTDDETYTEDPETIRRAVLMGIRQAKGGKYTEVIPDRKEALKNAFASAKKGDSVLITGLGHEDSRNMGGKLIPWSDQETARELLKK
jgi:UDP-N-acetylmuramoyl-L-alanyl-D-glutamate--2,6-diaminopimelate ligase